MSEVLTRPDRRSRILELHGAGLSSAKVARVIELEFGERTTKNMVLGIWNRAGLKGLVVEESGEAAERRRARLEQRRSRRQETVARSRERAERAARIAEERAQTAFMRAAESFVAAEGGEESSVTPPTSSVVPIGARFIPLMRLRTYDCRAVVNNARPGEPHLFCGLPRVDAKSSYCEFHDRLFNIGTVRR